MSNVSIFETRWIDLVFEGRNKDYGAYQLRQENPKTTLKALFAGLSLFVLLFTIPMIANMLNGQPPVPKEDYAVPLTFTDFFIEPVEPVVPESEQEQPPIHTEKPVNDIDRQELIDPEVVDAEQATPDVASNEEMENSNTEQPSEGGIKGNTNSSGTAGSGTAEKPAKSTGGLAPTGPYNPGVLDKMPAYPGGIDNFYRYVAKNFRAPSLDNEQMITVFVSFVIETDGSMTDIRVPRNPGFGLDKEAIRVLKSLKVKWAPGFYNGQAVRTAYSLPIKVKMQ